MSVHDKRKKMTVPDIIRMKERGEKIAVLTAYDFLTAQMQDEAGIDIILVGDSAGMVVAGYETTLPVTMEVMLHHVASAKRGTRFALLVADMPFLSYQTGLDNAIMNAGRFLKESGAEAVKLEGGEVVAEVISRMVRFGIPVMGHLGLTPQSIHAFGGYHLIGNEEKTAKMLVENARILEQAGVFSLVLEKVPALVAKEITGAVSIPTIGIGAGKFCDGQVLVSHDMLGLFDKFKPRFARRYADLGKTMRDAFDHYRDDVKSGKFPSDDESY
jgi:3-methyl-2-oxobutanoate hydroxymethyltransferase